MVLISYGKTFISLPKGQDPLEMTIEKAIELIKAKRITDANRQIKSFDEDNILILNGRFGAYITQNGKNYKIPKDMTPAELTLEDCKRLITEAAAKPKKQLAKGMKHFKKTTKK